MSRFKRDIFIMTDIHTRKDLEWLMEHFYAKLLSDDAINYIFTDVAKINLEQHLPHIVDFWEQVVLNTGSYKNNVLQIHLDLNEKVKLLPGHFEIWLHHFEQTVNSRFIGENASKMITRAVSIATVMKIKLQ